MPTQVTLNDPAVKLEIIIKYQRVFLILEY